jgi:hypothetical protein
MKRYAGVVMGVLLVGLGVAFLLRGEEPGDPPAPGGPETGVWVNARGESLPRDRGRLTLRIERGPNDHCNWGSATLMLLAWPPGSVTRAWVEPDGTYPETLRQYIRDPMGFFQADLGSSLDLDATLPPDAEATGFRHGSWELWISPSQADQHVFLVGRDRIERWPRFPYAIVCE